MSEFSKYHYPLVLKPNVNPAPESLHKAINRLSNIMMTQQKAMTEISDSAHSTWTNQFFKSDIHHYNPLQDENEDLKWKL